MEHRTYLWLHLAMEEIRETYQNKLYPDEVQIDSLPTSVDDAYERNQRKAKVERPEGPARHHWGGTTTFDHWRDGISAWCRKSAAVGQSIHSGTEQSVGISAGG
jgi:hypothetical protein